MGTPYAGSSDDVLMKVCKDLYTPRRMIANSHRDTHKIWLTRRQKIGGESLQMIT